MEEGLSADGVDVTPDRNLVEIDFTGVTYVHERRGPVTLSGAVTFHGTQSGCFPDPPTHLPSQLGTYTPSAENDCDFPLADVTRGVAVPADSFEEGVACGGCVSLFTLAGGETLQVVDLCEDCGPNQIRVHPAAVERQTRSGESGPVNIAWNFNTCQGLRGVPMSYHFREDSTPDRFAVQMRDIRHPVRTVEVETTPGEFVTLEREGSWLIGEGLGPGPFPTRVTSIYDHVVEDLRVPLVPGEDTPGVRQFRACYSDEE
jgi:hypothetical protein